MATDQRKLVTVLKAAVADLDEPFPGYRDELFDYVAQVVMLEREHERRATQIQKKVSDKIDALGRLIDARGGSAL